MTLSTSWIDRIGKGRLVAITVLALYGSLLTVVLGLTVMRHVPVLNLLGIPALNVPFMDLYGVAAWCEADSREIDPAVVQTNIRLPDGSLQPNFLMNYPPSVLWLRHIGLMPNRVVDIGILLGGLYLASAICLMGRVPMSDGFLWAVFLASPLSLMLIERANLDILVFACFAASLLLREKPWLSCVGILMAGILKLYPGAAFAALWMSAKRNSKLFAVAFCAALALYILTLLPRLSTISGSLQDQSKSCWGADVSIDIFLTHGLIGPSTAVSFCMGMKALSILVAISGIGIGFFMGKSADRNLLSERSHFAFWLAAPMSIILFILSNQMDYKWTFLLFLLPAVLECMKECRSSVRFLSKAWLVALAIYSYWTFFSGEESLRNAVMKQLVMWFVFFATTILTGVMLRIHPMLVRTLK